MSNINYHHGDLRVALISSARKILTEKGADALSLRAIASDVGVSHMAPYAHFKNKKELFKSIAANGFNELADNMEKNGYKLTKAHSLILAYGVTYVQFALDHPQLYRLMLGQVENSGRRNQKKNLNTSIFNSLVSNHLEESSNRSFLLLRDAYANVNKQQDQLKTEIQALGAWAMVHGMAALIIEGHIKIPDTMTLKDFLAKTAVQSLN